MTTASCKDCLGIGIEPCRMFLPEGPLCSCGKPSRLQSGMCSKECKGGKCLTCGGHGYEGNWTLTCAICGTEGIKIVCKTEDDKLGCRRCHYRGATPTELLESEEYRERVFKVDFDNRRAARKKIERALFDNLKRRNTELAVLLSDVNEEWTYEDGIYRFYHHSFKVYYRLQPVTEKIVETLRSLVPSGTELNRMFLQILSEGTGKEFHVDHNAAWMKHTRPIVEAFFHAKFFLEMAVKCEEALRDLEDPPQMLPSGWAALLYLYNIR